MPPWPCCNPGSSATHPGTLIIATHGAVALPGEDLTNLPGAAVWGLVRSAQSENPGRLVLADVDGALEESTLATILAVGEPQVVIRNGSALHRPG